MTRIQRIQAAEMIRPSSSKRPADLPRQFAGRIPAIRLPPMGRKFARRRLHVQCRRPDHLLQPSCRADVGPRPKLNDPEDRFCGSFKLYAADGTPITHDNCWMALALRDGKAYHAQEIVVERPDHRRFTVLAHANPLWDENGKLIGAINVLVDITDRTRADRAESLLAAIVKSSDDAIYSRDLSGPHPFLERRRRAVVWLRSRGNHRPADRIDYAPR